jgi:hypothetical protein
MTEINVTPMEPGWYGVQVREGYDTTSHRVRIPEELRTDLGVFDADDESLVRETFNFLLEKEPATAIRKEFGLDEVGGYFDDFYDQLRARLTPA